MSTTESSEDRGASPFTEDVNSMVEALLKEYHVPGISVAVVDNNHGYSKGYGYASLPDTKATGDTLWWSGSTTKAFVAAAVGLLIENPEHKDKLKWNTPLKQILEDDLVLQDEYAMNNVSFEDALSHRSGSPRHDVAYGWTGSDQASVVKTLRYLPFTDTFRTSWQYCNTMYAAVGAALEKFTGKPNDQLLKETIWEPLGMKSTFWGLEPSVEHASKNDKNNLARGYYWVDPKKRSEASVSTIHDETEAEDTFIPEPFIDLLCVGAAGTIVSSVNDYALWIRALLKAAAGSPDPNKYPDAKAKPKKEADKDTKLDSVITSTLFTALTTPRMVMTNHFPFPDSPTLGPYINPDLYALGWMIAPRIFPGELVIHHAGGLSGFGTQLFILPEHNFGVVTMANTALTSNVIGEYICYELMARKLGLSEDKRKELVEKKKEYSDKVMTMMGFRAPDQDEDKKEGEDGDKKSEDDDDKKKKEEGPTKHDTLNTALQAKASIPDNFDIQALEGEFHNPAYGNYTFKLVDDKFVDELDILRYPSKTNVKSKSTKSVIHDPHTDTTTIADPDQAATEPLTTIPSRASAAAVDLDPTMASSGATPAETSTTSSRGGPSKRHPMIYVEPQGHRCWGIRWLLRHESSVTDPDAKDKRTIHVFSSEVLKLHGQTSIDPIKIPESMPAGQLPPEKIVYDGSNPVRGGAVFISDPSGGIVDAVKGAVGATRGNVKKVGMVLEGDMNEAAVRNGWGWERGMMWFDRV